MANSIRVEGLCAGYGSVQVLDRISLSVNDGETVTLLGTNGNGKSTLIKCIMGVVRPTAGRIAATILPADGRTMPITHFSSVLLPLPLVPSSVTVSPAPTASDTSCSTRTAP